ncbi:MAG: kinase [Actinomycetota bacterium]|nr:kinase [Actinomycetota bacterium]
MPGHGELAPIAAVFVLLLCAILLFLLGRRVLSPDGSHRDPSGQAPGPERRKAAFVINPIKIDSERRRRAWATEACRQVGLSEPLWLRTTPEDPGSGQTRQALDRGAGVILAFGGDGTVRSVASELASTGIPLGILPAGTGNLFARNLGVSVSDLDDALQVAFGGTERTVDIGRAEIDVTGRDSAPRQESFLVMAGLGFDAEVMAEVEPRLKQKVGWWAYVVAGMRLLHGRRTKVAIRRDDGPPLVRRIRSVVIGNCGELTGGIQLMPEARLDDGWLDVVVVSPRGVAGWAAVAAAVLTRSRRHHTIVDHFRCRKIEIRAERPLHVQMDGDPSGTAKVLRVHVDPSALTVRSPMPRIPWKPWNG